MATGSQKKSGKNTQKKLGEVRAPRVQISYDVESGDEIKQKTLPFVVGVLADLGSAAQSEMRLRDRSFVDIDADNFDKVLAAMKPKASLSVVNKLGGDGEQLRVDLSFSEIDDFSPAAVARQVPQLAQLLDARGRLNDLLAKLEGNERLNDLLAEVVLNTEVQTKAYSQQRDKDELASAGDKKTS